jgi:hypothetical protein
MKNFNALMTLVIPLAVAAALALTACDTSGVEKDTGIVSINFGSTARKMAGNSTPSDALIAQLSHTVRLTDTSGSEATKWFKKGQTVANITIRAGSYTVSVDAWCGDDEDSRMLYGMGSNTVEVIAGEVSSVTVELKEAVYSAKFFEISLAGSIDWSMTIDAISTSSNANPGGKYCIVLTGDTYSYAPVALTDAADILVVGGHSVTLNMSGGSLLDIQGNGVNVTLQDVELIGSTGNTSPLVAISGGSFTMNGNSKISGNENTSASPTGGWGGGVCVEGGSFTMNGKASISGNTANSFGGGVYVTGAGSKFTMNVGKITGNQVDNGSGGGVFVENGGKFTMNDGIITDNHAYEGVNPGTGLGGGVYVDASFTINSPALTSVYNNTADNVVVSEEQVFLAGNGSIDGTGSAGFTGGW